VVAGVGSLAAVALVVPQAQRLSRERACGDGDERLARAWSPADQTTALGRIAGLSAYGAKLAPLLARQLRGYAERWTTGYKDACLARFSGTLSEGLLDQRMACLERSRTVVASLPKLFDGTTASAVSGLALAVNALPSPETCSDLDALMSPVKPPPAHQRDRVGQLRSDLDRARVQVAAGKYPEASAVANGVASEARSLDYRPLIAEALLVEGHATMGMNRREAIAPLNEATTLALEVGANALAVEAWARRSWTEGTSGDVPGSLAGVELVEALAAGLPGPRFERSLLYNNIGCVEVAMQERGRAHRSFGRAFAEARDVTGPGAVELLIVQTNLAFTSDDPVRRDLLFTQGIERMTRLLGADHPQTLDAGLVWGRSEPRLARAREILQAACRGMEQHPSLSSLQATCWKELGIVRSELDDPVGASEAMAAGWRAASRQDKVGEGQYRGLEPDYLLRTGKFADAAQLFRTALAAVPQLPGEAWWRTVRRAEVELGLGRSLKALGDLRGAAAVLKAAVKRLVPLVDRQPRADFERRLGRARIELAHVLADQGKAHEALEFGTGGMEWLRRVGGSPLEIQKLTRLGVR
jgi:tetratricopeptide (TPR) repeat protein